MSIIDNCNKTMLEALREQLKQSERVDIVTAFFYFSGFNELAEELKEKHVRILVGDTIDPQVVETLHREIESGDDSCLSRYADRDYPRLNNLQKKDKYIQSFIGLVNRSQAFDESESQNALRIFMEKLSNGTLEIRLTAKPDHRKAYIFTYRSSSIPYVPKGSVIMGSSNFTYSGLIGQGEANEKLASETKYGEYSRIFESMWNDSQAVNIHVKGGNTNFVEGLKNELWLFAKPSPYHVYIRILFELYNSLDETKVKPPHEISSGKFSNLKYQIDAIKYGIGCIHKNNGVIIADVVGLGKSIIASAIAHNLNISKTVIIAPPHLVDQWNEYLQDFGLRGARAYSSGSIEKIYQTYSADKNPILYIIDEAHRYRNEQTDDYMYLHQLTRSNVDNKVILLTATPYNNRPQDLFALVKLFQTPSRSTIQSVDNLGVRFQELITRYAKLEKEGKRNLSNEVKVELEELSKQLRILIDPVIVRRSRIDLKEIEEYRLDLETQGIAFPEVIGPELVEYDLGEIRDLYLSTLEKLSSDHFHCARYNPTNYLDKPDEFMKQYEELFEIDLRLSQKNLAEFIRRLLIMRFESSKSAFKTTLDNIITSYENIKKWWDKGYVPIKKKGYLSDPDDVDFEEILDELEKAGTEEFDLEKIKKKEIPFKRELFKPDFIIKVDEDLKLLRQVKTMWFDKEETGYDPKFEEVKSQVATILKQNMKRKIVIFSSFADTAKYIHKRFADAGFKVFLYTGGSSKTERDTVRQNFDASVKLADQKNDYDIIVATDALSEGFNLNRAGVIVNYDIPYNPTRVVQRIGRINRINKKMFEKIYILNFFPTDIGESNILIKGISTLKMLLITNIVGSDTKTLTEDETLQSYFKRQYEEADSSSSEKSWDNEFRNAFNSIKHNTQLMTSIMKIPERSRIVRKNSSNQLAIAFAKRGNNTLFALATPDVKTAKIVSAEEILKYFRADSSEKAHAYDDTLDKKFAILREEITKPYPKIRMTQNRIKAGKNLEVLKDLYPQERDYFTALLEVIDTYDDLSDGELSYLRKVVIKQNNLRGIVEDIRQTIPEHYIIQIKQRAENVEAQAEVIMFTEDLRSES